MKGLLCVSTEHSTFQEVTIRAGDENEWKAGGWRGGGGKRKRKSRGNRPLQVTPHPSNLSSCQNICQYSFMLNNGVRASQYNTVTLTKIEDILIISAGFGNKLNFSLPGQVFICSFNVLMVMKCLIRCLLGKWEQKATCSEGKSTCPGRLGSSFLGLASVWLGQWPPTGKLLRTLLLPGASCVELKRVWHSPVDEARRLLVLDHLLLDQSLGCLMEVKSWKCLHRPITKKRKCINKGKSLFFKSKPHQPWLVLMHALHQCSILMTVLY